MKQSTHNPVFLSFIIFLFFIHLPAFAVETKIRQPVFAGSWYPGTRSELTQTISELTLRAKKTPVNLPAGQKLKGLILPHAGYIYSGFTAAHASHVLKKKQFSKVILMGPDHRIGFKNGSVSNAEAFKTPLGLVYIHPNSAALKLQTDLFKHIPDSDRLEHSLENVLPFLQYYLEDFKLVPLVLGPCNIDQISNAINTILTKDTLIVVSSDLSHFLSYSKAVQKDKSTIDLILGLKSRDLMNQENSACGRIPILILLNLAKRHSWKPYLIHYSNSGDQTHDRSRVVGYAAIAFFENIAKPAKQKPVSEFNEKQGQALIKLARYTILKKLGLISDITIDSFESTVSVSDFQIRGGTFVTLTKKGRLRGCIGNLVSEKTVISGIKTHAVSAAFRDPRFPPVSFAEMDDIKISISILTRPKPLDYQDGPDLISRLRVNVDGVILRQGKAEATFLPQVWSQLPRPEQFLSQLCRKAGLPQNAWTKTKLEIQTYQVQYFEEKQ